MKRIAQIIIVSVVIIAILSVVFTVFIPSHTGEIRQDLREGDYYTLETQDLSGRTEQIKNTVIGFTDSGDVKVRSEIDGEFTEYTQTKSQYLQDVLFQYDKNKCENLGYATLDTDFGSRFCTIYSLDGCDYWVGEHDIVYKYSVHGIGYRLVGTSLIIS